MLSQYPEHFSDSIPQLSPINDYHMYPIFLTTKYSSFIGSHHIGHPFIQDTQVSHKILPELLLLLLDVKPRTGRKMEVEPSEMIWFKHPKMLLSGYLT